MYRIEPVKGIDLDFVIVNAVDPNKFALGPPILYEEKIAYHKRKNENTPQENLRELVGEMFQANWRASELYPWFEECCPGYQIRQTSVTNNARVSFESLDHAMLFKLRWCGI